MKNKILNPTGVCNWDCYQARYAGVLGGMNQEEMKIYWLNTGKPSGQNCLCQEIQSIEITLNVDECDLVKTHHDQLFPDPRDKDYESEQGRGNPMWYIKQETTWKPTLDHPLYWINKFYP